MSGRELGRVVRLQIQRSSLKVGPQRGRNYDPEPILSVPRLHVAPDGASAWCDGAEMLDVHNALHAVSKNRDGVNDLSIGFTGNYRRIRAEFGGHIVDGIAGESILVACDDPPTLDELAGGVEVETVRGCFVTLGEASVAHPCVEFSRFCLGPDAAEPRKITAALQFLDNGTRGYYVGLPAGASVEIAVGAVVRIA